MDTDRQDIRELLEKCNTIREANLAEIDRRKEMVNHPDHYQGNKLEVIDVIEDYNLGFHLGNAIKYILRADAKGNRKQDLQKAIWYIKREIDREDL